MTDHAFDKLLRPHMDRLYRFAWRLTSSKPEAEDLFQEVLLKAYGRLDRLAELDEPGSWLCRVMYNLFVDDRRRYSRERLRTIDEGQLPGAGLDDIAGNLDPVIDRQRLERIRSLDRALSRLSDEHRLVVLMHDTDGYKLEEIQEITGTPVGTIKSRLHRARARLREMLEKDGTLG